MVYTQGGSQRCCKGWIMLSTIALMALFIYLKKHITVSVCLVPTDTSKWHDARGHLKTAVPVLHAQHSFNEDIWLYIWLLKVHMLVYEHKGVRKPWSAMCAWCVVARDGVVLATEKKQKSILYDDQTIHKVEQITKNIGMVYSGMGPDYRYLIVNILP